MYLIYKLLGGGVTFVTTQHYVLSPMLYIVSFLYFLKFQYLIIFMLHILFFNSIGITLVRSAIDLYRQFHSKDNSTLRDFNQCTRNKVEVCKF